MVYIYILCKANIIKIFHLTDVGCGYRAIVVGVRHCQLSMNYINDVQDPVEKRQKELEWRKICARGYKEDFQIKSAQNFCVAAGLDYNTPLSAIHFDKVQEYLSSMNIRLIIVDARNVNAGEKLFEGPYFNDTICIEYQSDNDGHYNFITSLRGYQEASYFCKYCYQGHHSIKHICKYCCPACGQRPICEKTEEVDCPVCHKRFKNNVRCKFNSFILVINNFSTLRIVIINIWKLNVKSAGSARYVKWIIWRITKEPTNVMNFIVRNVAYPIQCLHTIA